MPPGYSTGASVGHMLSAAPGSIIIVFDSEDAIRDWAGVVITLPRSISLATARSGAFYVLVGVIISTASSGSPCIFE